MSFQVPEEVVDRLFCGPHVVRKLGWTLSVEARIAPEPNVRGVQIVVSSRNDARVQLITDPLVGITELSPLSITEIPQAMRGVVGAR